jgi:hypothetical protein
MSSAADWADFRAHLARVAVKAARAHIAGETHLRIGHQRPQTFDLATGGYCARFVRMAAEVTGAEHFPESNTVFDWEHKAHGLQCAFNFARANARLMEQAIREVYPSRGTHLDDAEPGDIVGINKPASVRVGHIALFVGEVDGVPCIAENTSVAGRGKPRVKGTKLTPWASVAKRVTGLYRLDK